VAEAAAATKAAGLRPPVALRAPPRNAIADVVSMPNQAKAKG
jgi:hypothetical protein